MFQLFRNDRKCNRRLNIFLFLTVYKKKIDGIISEPSFREYIFYSDCKDLTSPDRILPSRQYTIVKDNEIRMMYTQTTDALYN